MYKYRLTTRGFTLLEIMLVVFVISITAFLIVPSGSAENPYAKLEQEASRFIRVVELAQQEALLSGQFLALVVESDHYQVFQVKSLQNSISGTTSQQRNQLSDDGVLQIDLEKSVVGFEWEELQRKEFLKYEAKEELVFATEVDGLRLIDQEEDPSDSVKDQLSRKAKNESFDVQFDQAPPAQILFFPSGEMSPFTLTMQWQEDKQYYTMYVKGDMMGRVKLLDEQKQEIDP